MKKTITKLLLLAVIVLCAFALFSCASYEYTVKYYNETADGTYVEQRIEKQTTSDTVLNFKPSEQDHYTVNYEKSKLTADFSKQTDVVIEVYYDAQRYNVVFDIGNLNLVSGELTQTVFYGKGAVAPTVESSDKAKFVKWDIAFDKIESDLTVKAVCDTSANVNIYHKIEGADGNYETTLKDTITVDASKGAYTYEASKLNHYTINSGESTLICTPSVNKESSVTVCYDRALYNVKFQISGLDLTSGEIEQSVKYGDKAIAPIVSNNDKCEFVKWDKDVTKAIEGNTTFTAEVNSNAKVTVSIYRENSKGEFLLHDTIESTQDARLGSYTYKAPTQEGYTFDKDSSTVKTDLAVNGEYQLTVYYKINWYTVKFNVSELDCVSGELVQSIAYGEGAVAPQVANTSKYAFVKWDKSFDNITGDLTVTAVTTTDAPVKVIIYKESLNGEYIQDSEKTVYADTSRTEYTYTPSSVSNHTLNTEKSVLTVTPDILNTQTISVYYDLARFKVTFNIGSLDHTGGGDLVQNVPYGGSAIAPEVSGTRTAAFKNWNKAFNKITADTTVNAVTTSDATIKVTYYVESLEGGYVEGETKILTVSSIPETYTHAPMAKTGYTINKAYGNSTCPLYAGKEEAINIYYDLKRYTVTFVYEGLTLSSGNAVQTVPHGGSAIAPTLTNSLTVVFDRWDKSFDKITSDLTVTAISEHYTPIYTRTDLERIELDLGANYILADDISLSSGAWTPLGTFTGKLLGNGHIITGVTFSGQNEVGLFSNNKGIIDGVTLKDCSVQVSITNGNSWLILSSFLSYKNNGTIKNCRIIGANSFNYAFKCSQEIGCYSDAAFTHFNWTNNFRAGAYSCYNNGVIDNCSLEGTLNFNITADIYYKFNTWLYTNVGSGSFTINANGAFGGFCAENNGDIQQCRSTAAIKSYGYAKSVSETGGSGRNHVYAYTNVTFGTIAAVNNDSIDRCETLVGVIDSGSVSTNCGEAHARNNVTTDSAQYKTLVGENKGSITSSVATTS